MKRQMKEVRLLLEMLYRHTWVTPQRDGGNGCRNIDSDAAALTIAVQAPHFVWYGVQMGIFSAYVLPLRPRVLQFLRMLVSGEPGRISISFIRVMRICHCIRAGVLSGMSVCHACFGQVL